MVLPQQWQQYERAWFTGHRVAIQQGARIYSGSIVGRSPATPSTRGRVCDAEIIELSVRWYITYRVSYRDLVAMMAERGVVVAHGTILPWVTGTCRGPGLDR